MLHWHVNLVSAALLNPDKLSVSISGEFCDLVSCFYIETYITA
jgi:hypothetical protein